MVMKKKVIFTYEDYIRRSIIVNNRYGIKDIRNLENIRSTYLIRADYSKIVDLINNNEIEKIKNFKPGEIKVSEYITISKFLDQNGKKYIVTSYDSDLSRDPQVLDIFSSSLI
jgi:hypothetical protein